MTSAQIGTGARLPGLDVLRGIAIALVLLRHSWPTVFPGAGIVGVVMFFALSGYLITGLLHRELLETGAISLFRFARARVVRLFPALALMLAVFWIVESVANPLHDRAIATQTIFAALFYLRDLPLPFATSPAINTLWTLAVEEQFYLIWPLVLILAFRTRTLRITLITLGTALILVSSVSVLIFIHDPANVYIFPTTWASALVIGAAAAIYREPLRAFIDISSVFRRRALLGLAAVIFAGLCIVPGAKNVPWMYIAAGPVVAVLTILVIFTVGQWPALHGRAWRALRLLGLISYGVYLWNSLVLNWFVPLGPVSGALAIPATIALAILSWFTVERLGRKLMQSFRGAPAGLAHPANT